MKKLIAISVVLALVATAAFAETSISGALELQWRGIIGEGNLDGGSFDDVYFGRMFAYAEAYFQMSRTNDDGTFRALLRNKFAGNGLNSPIIDNNSTASVINRSFIWWEPIDQLSLFFGKEEDGYFGQDHIAGWGFHRGARFVAVERFRGGEYFIGAGFGVTPAFAMSIKPIDGLQINTAINLEAAGRRKAEDIGDFIGIELAYDLGVGRALVAYKGEGVGNQFGFSFISTSLVDGIEFGLGFIYLLDDKYEKDNAMRISLTFAYSGGDFGVKFRTYVDAPDTIKFTADVMPWYKLDFGEARLSIRISKDGDKDLGWLVNPYLVLNAGAANLRAGLMVTNMDAAQSWNTFFAPRADDKISWNIPVGIAFSF